MNKNPLSGLMTFGQSIWVDNLSTDSADNADSQMLHKKGIL
jgi:hypothetical protein